MPDQNSDSKMQDEMKAEHPATSTIDQGAVEAPQKKKRKPRYIPADHLSEFRELVKAHKSEEEICDDMGLDKKKFLELYFLLCQHDKTPYEIVTKAPMRKSRVKENGFMVTTGRLAALGLENIFAEGKELKFKRERNALVISVVDSE